MNKRLMLRALLVFLTTGTLAVVINSFLLGYGWHTEFSISRYVGLETWSSVIFALGNVVVMLSMLYYLYEVGELWRMPRWYYYLVIVMAIGLVGLSACPVGYFDVPGTNLVSLPSRVHEVCSRTMFAMMLAVAIMVVACKQATEQTRILSALFALYGGFCLFGYFTHAPWFFAVLLFLESAYLIGFIILCLNFKDKKEQIKDVRAKARR